MPGPPKGQRECDRPLTPIQCREEGAHGSKGSLPKRSTERTAEMVSWPAFLSALQLTTTDRQRAAHERHPGVSARPTPTALLSLVTGSSIPLLNAPGALDSSRPHWLAEWQGSLSAALASLW